MKGNVKISIDVLNFLINKLRILGKLVGEIKSEENHTSYHSAIRNILKRYGFNQFDYTNGINLYDIKDGNEDE